MWVSLDITVQREKIMSMKQILNTQRVEDKFTEFNLKDQNNDSQSRDEAGANSNEEMLGNFTKISKITLRVRGRTPSGGRGNCRSVQNISHNVTTCLTGTKMTKRQHNQLN